MIVIRNFRNNMQRLVCVYAALSNPRYRDVLLDLTPLSRQGVDIRDSTLPPTPLQPKKYVKTRQ